MPSALPVAMVRRSGLTATPRIAPLWPRRLRSARPPSRAHTVATLSLSANETRVRSSTKARLTTGSSLDPISPVRVHPAVSKTDISPFASGPATRVRPSGLKAADRASAPTWRVRSERPVAGSHTLRVPSALLVTRRWPSGL